MIFPSNQSGGPPCPIEGKRRPLQVRIEIRYEWSCKKLYGSDVRRHSWTIHVHAALYGRHGRESDSLSGHKCHVRSAMEKKNRPVDRRGAGFSRTLPSGYFPAMPGHLSPCTIICLLSCNRVFFRSGGSPPVSFVSVSVSGKFAVRHVTVAVQ